MSNDNGKVFAGVENPKQSTQKDLIDVIDFSSVLPQDNPLTYYKGEFSRHNPTMCFNGISASLIFVYLCKHNVKNMRQVYGFIIPFLSGGSSFMPYLTDDEKRIVFRSFKVDNLVDIMNVIENNSNVFNAVLRDYSAADAFKRAFISFTEHDLDLFVQETGADKFVAYIKLLQVQQKRELEIQHKKEEEDRKRAEAAEKERQAKEIKAREDAEKKQAIRDEKVSKRLQKLADNLNAGIFKYTMKLPFDKDITKDDIARLSHDDPGVIKMFTALVNVSNKIRTAEQLGVFDDMLYFMQSHFQPSKCLHNTTVKNLMSVAGIENFDANNDAYVDFEPAHIKRYKKILLTINKYPYVFKNGFGLNYTDHPHNQYVEISKYNSKEEYDAIMLERQEIIIRDKGKDSNEYYKIEKALDRTPKTRPLKRAILQIKKHNLDKKIEDEVKELYNQYNNNRGK